MAQRARPASLPAPVGGWNARDALADMEATDAVYLTNWWPRTSDIQLRNGYTNFATGLGAQVETLLSYAGASTTKMFGITSAGNLYDVTSTGAVGAALVTGLSNGRWQYVNMATAGGNFLLAFNGVDNGLRYDGTKWVTVPSSTGLAIAGGTGTGAVCTLNVVGHGLMTGNTVTVTGCSDAGYNQAGVSVTRVDANHFSYAGTGTGSTAGGSYTVAEGISGVSPKNIVNVSLFKHRLWLTENASLKHWYLGTDSIAGAASAFAYQSIAYKGGYLVASAAWTLDAGYGVDDLFVTVTSRGQVMVYRGTDPASADTWALVGVWDLGAPVGRRCFTKYAGDLLMISQDGLLPLASALQSSRLNPKVALTNKIQFAVSDAITAYGSNFGWQTIYFPKQNMLLLNVPISTGSQQQYAMNTVTKAWCNFTGWGANCWELFNDNLYFGGNGVVGQAWNGLNDNGKNIASDGKQAFNYFNSPGLLKRFTMMRPIIGTSGQPSILAALNVDFDDTAPTGPISFANTTSGIWDSSLWDVGTWAGDNQIQKQWQGVTGIGYCAAPRLRTLSQGIDVRWMATDLVMEVGGIL